MKNRPVAHPSSMHRHLTSVKWEPERPAERLSDSIIMSRGISNSYLVTTSDGDLVINTGTSIEGNRHRERYEEILKRPLKVQKIIFTQSHVDHTGGWTAFDGPGVETIAQRAFSEGYADWQILRDFAGKRSHRLHSSLSGLSQPRAILEMKEPVLTGTFDDSMAFDVGNTRVELYSIPGGETTNGLAVWLPEDRTIFIGNMLGALYGMLPHLVTVRGDRLRDARAYVRSVDRILALDPEILITGHDEPITGSERIRADLTRLREAVRYIHDETVKGMNDGKDLWTLMAEIRLPDNLQPVPQGRGRLEWYVRAVWEIYAGWFRYESATELYAVPQQAIWPEVVEMAGGSDAVSERAAARVRAGEPVEALHLTDIVLHVDPGHRGARLIELEALTELLERSGGDAWDELRWLETEIDAVRASLDEDLEV